MAKMFKRSVKKRVKKFKRTSTKQAKTFSTLNGKNNIVGRKRGF